ncbi:MAG: hypothetical protein ACHQAX_05790 [Gammaproteobacteria bacterium]
MIFDKTTLKPMELVTLHKEAATVSFKEKFNIMSTMHEHLGQLRLTHISLDLCSPDNVMLFLSSNPTTGYNVCSTPLWKMDGSISPTNFKNKDFYWWDDCYIPEGKQAIIERKENAHGISRGFMICKKVNDFYFVYSFGLGQHYIDNESFVQEHRDAFMKVGDLAYTSLRDLYQKYCPQYKVPAIKTKPAHQLVIR